MNSGKIKILHIEDRFNPDYGYQLNNLARFHSSLFEFHILSSTSFFPWKNTDKDEIIRVRDKEFEAKNNVKLHRLGYSFEIESRVWMKNLRKSINEINPDIIFIHGFETFTAIRIILSRKPKTRLIFSDTHVLLHLSRSKLLWKIFLCFVKTIYVPIVNNNNIPVFYTVNENKQILKFLYKISEHNILPGIIGTNTENFMFSDQKRTSMRSGFKIKDSDCIILFTGKIDRYKKPHLILQALKQNEEKILSEIYVFFIGEVEKEYFKKEFDIKINNPRVNIQILPKVPSNELTGYYSMADFAVFPTYNTLSSLDSQANRLPVIMERNKTNQERLKYGGLLFEKNNIRDLGEKMIRLINDPELRIKLATAGEQYMRTKFDYKMINHDMENYILSRWAGLKEQKQSNT